MNRRCLPLIAGCAVLLALPAPAPAPIQTKPKAAVSAGTAEVEVGEPAAPPPVGAPAPLAPPASLPAAAAPPAASGAQSLYRAGQYLGPVACAASGCHGNVAPGQVYGVLQNEFETWFRLDRHRRAFDLLWSKRSAHIARNLKLERPATESALCLNCHLLSAARTAQVNRLEREDGISCESCHGPAGGWMARHHEAGWSHADSVAAGMVDLQLPSTRARVCLGCHQGEPGRQVDHALLAAGHPELIFELDNYSEAMPAHWATASRNPGSRGLRAWAVGQVEAFRSGLRLLSSRAQSSNWPEFAEMSCDSCHHDLAGGAWRQQRGYRHRPGSPPWSPARYAVLRHLVAAVDSAAGSVDGSLNVRLAAAVDDVAAGVADFGASPSSVVEASERAGKLLGEVSARVERFSWSGRAARQLLAAILADREGLPAADRQSAEQTALAVQSLSAHLPKGKSAQLVRQLFALLDDPHRFDREQFIDRLAELEAELSR